MDNILPVYILIRTSRRPQFFKKMMDSIKEQTYPNIITIVHTDDPRDTYVEGDIIIKGTTFPQHMGTAPYNLYNNRLLESIPDKDGYFCFLDDDDMYVGPDVIERFVESCQKDKLNVCRASRWDEIIFPKKWKGQNTFQTECFMLHTKYKDKGRWWANKGGDHYYTGQLTRCENDPLKINWVDNLLLCKAQVGKGHGRRIDLDGSTPRRLCKTDQVMVHYMRDIMSPFPARGKKGETKTIPGNYAEYLEKKGLVIITHEENKVKLEA